MRVACAQYAIRDDVGPPTSNGRWPRSSTPPALGPNSSSSPSSANSGCDFSSRESALSIAEKVGDTRILDGPTLRAWREAAEETGIFVVGGFLEREAITCTTRRSRRPGFLRTLPQERTSGTTRSSSTSRVQTSDIRDTPLQHWGPRLLRRLVP
jgi:hypothetical protein